MSRNNYSNSTLGAPDTPGGKPATGYYPPIDISDTNEQPGFDIPSGYVVTPTLPPDGDDFNPYDPITPTDTIEETDVITDPSLKASVRLVVGWLVCISGPCKGQDFRLHNGWNYIGRDPSMDVYLEDSSVSRQRVVKIAYDPESLTFGVAPCEGSSLLCRLNGKPLRGDRDFESHDRLKIGNSELILIPFCSEKFSWEDEQA